jgi:hypothetical protein
MLKDRPGFKVEASYVAPPFQPAQSNALDRRLAQYLPDTFRHFLTLGTAAIDCRYSLDEDSAAGREFSKLFIGSDLYGGARIGPANALPRFARSCLERSRVLLEDQDTDRADDWVESLPIIAVGNGDYVALNGIIGREIDDPAVLYLSHDGDDAVMTESFTAFLAAWEHLCYVSPDLLLQNSFFAAGYALLDPDSRRAKKLRQLFGLSAIC